MDMYKVISTFSGIGGSSQGYKQAGFNVLASVEFLDYQAANYRLNHPGTRLYQSDIRKLDPLQILKDVGLEVGQLDILDGSPPCSSFSTAGSIEKGWGKVKPYGNTKQRTDDLFFEYIRFLQAMQPKVFVAENVTGLVKGAAKGHFNQFLRAFVDCGYNVKAKVLNAANYDVPQKRERLIFVGVRKDLNLDPVYPEPKKEKITLREAFKNVINTDDELKEADVTKSYHYKHLVKLKPGEVCENPFLLAKEHPDKPCRTITATGISASGACHWNNRKFTISELKIIGSFPTSYQLIGKNYQEKGEGIARAVPPKMMEAIARAIKNEILDKLI